MPKTEEGQELKSLQNFDFHNNLNLQLPSWVTVILIIISAIDIVVWRYGLHQADIKLGIETQNFTKEKAYNDFCVL